MATHLITGGSGFMGSLISKQLLADGHKVKILDIWQDPNQSSEIEFINCDIRNYDAVFHAMRRVDMVHHNAALVPLTKSGKEFESVNVHGSEVAAQAALKAGVETFIHMSSSAIYGAPKILPITSETPYNPIEIYGRGKLSGEQIVRRVLNDTNVKTVVIRPRTIIGEGRLGIFQVLFRWISENKNVYTIGNGDNLFQFIHAEDLISAYMIASQHNESANFNVGTTEYGTLKNALENLINHAGSNSKVKSLPRKSSILALTTLDKLKLSPLAPWHYLTYDKPFYFDMNRLVSLGWRPKYSNDRMLAESYDSFRSKDWSEGRESFSAHRKTVNEGFLRLIRKIS